jgi:acetylornithine deacetylase/succinyl-diaminopimelate desuccinylase-like protein
MTDTPQEALQYARDNQTRFIDELKELVRIPSISTDPEARDDMLRAAEWLAAHLRQLNCQNVQIIPTPGHPMVYGEWLEAGPDKPVAERACTGAALPT